MRTVQGRTDHVVVVGAGFAGLAAASHLAGRGRQVTVVERDSVPGGRAGRIDLHGYRLDTGPTVLTMPEIIEDTLAAVGDSLQARIRLVPVDPAYRARFADGSSLDIHRDATAMEESINEFSGATAVAEYRRFRAWLTKLYRTEFDRFVARNLDSPLAVLTPAFGRIAAMGAFGSLDRVVRRFFRDERLRRVFSFQSLYVGLSPQHARALYAVVAYMDAIAGVFFPLGGMRAVPDGLASAVEHAGVRFRYSTLATSLERRGDRVRAVRTHRGERIPCDAVVLSTELPTSYRLLGHTPRRPVRLRAAPSAVVLHLACRGPYPGLAHHNILFGQAWESIFHELRAGGTLMHDPSLLVTRPTATDPALAPPDAELISILAPAPNLHSGGIDWQRRGAAYADELISVVEQRLLPRLSTESELLHLSTPLDWQRQGMIAGTPFALSHELIQSGPFRPGNFPRGLDNAVLAGASTVPGVGIPTALLSGRLAADRITGTRVNSERVTSVRAAPERMR